MQTYEVICTSPQQFQQPSRFFQDAYAAEIDIRAAENSSCQYLHRLEENSTRSHESEEGYEYMNDDDDEDDLVQTFKGFLKELNVRGCENIKKLACRVEKDIPIERVLRETLHDFKGKPGSDKLEKFVRKVNRGGGKRYTSTERGVDDDISQQGMKHKLERFKVKAVNVIGSGVVKEEGK